MIEVQYFYRSTEALLVKIVFTENWLFKDNFLEKVGGANAPPAPPAPPPMKLCLSHYPFVGFDLMRSLNSIEI